MPPIPRTLAPTPPMGWNSWDCFGTSVTEDEVMANARFMAEHLLPHGWDTVVIDIQWYEPTARAGGYNADAPIVLDAWGRPMPAENRFPSSANGAGFAPLAHRIHQLGLRFGLHLMRGIPRRAVEADLPIFGTDFHASDIADPDSTCDWNSDNFGIDHARPGAQAYYDSIAALFSEWGLDYVKVDDMVGPFHSEEIEAFSRAIAGAGRDIVLSLSPGQMLSTVHGPQLREHSDLWRISADLWDEWPDILGQFDRLALWAPFAGDGRWPDADMLPLGRIGIRAERGPERQSRLTEDEARTMMTLWMMARSPLMFGGDLPQTEKETMSLLTNDAALGVLRSSTNNREVLHHDGLVAWTADATDRPARYAAIFAIGETPIDVDLPLTSLGVAGPATVTELWTGHSEGPIARLRHQLVPHSCLLLAIETSGDLR